MGSAGEQRMCHLSVAVGIQALSRERNKCHANLTCQILKDCQIQISQIVSSSHDKAVTCDWWFWHFRPCLGWHDASQRTSQGTREKLGRAFQARQAHSQRRLFCFDLLCVPTLAGSQHQSQRVARGMPKGRAFPLSMGAWHWLFRRCSPCSSVLQWDLGVLTVPLLPDL